MFRERNEGENKNDAQCSFFLEKTFCAMYQHKYPFKTLVSDLHFVDDAMLMLETSM